MAGFPYRCPACNGSFETRRITRLNVIARPRPNKREVSAEMEKEEVIETLVEILIKDLEFLGYVDQKTDDLVLLQARWRHTVEAILMRLE